MNETMTISPVGKAKAMNELFEITRMILGNEKLCTRLQGTGPKTIGESISDMVIAIHRDLTKEAVKCAEE